MAEKKWVVTDVAHATYHDDLSISPQDVGGSADGYSETKKTLRGGLTDGVDVISVDNGEFSFVVVPTRGMGVWKAWLGETEIGWQSPVRGPVHPKFVPVSEGSGIGWLDGFDELLVRCGLESNGAPEFDDSGRVRYPLHGRIANRPAHRVEIHIDGESGEVTILGVVEESRFHLNKLRLTSTIKTKPGELGFRIHDVVENFGGVDTEAQLLYHVNFGQPLVDPGSQLVAPAKVIVPRTTHAADDIEKWNVYPNESPGFEEQVYFGELAADDQGETRVLLKNAHSTRGVTLRYDKRKLPCFTLWKNPVAAADGYVTGLEPGTNFPNPRTFEGQQQRVVKLPPGKSISFDLALEVHGTSASVEAGEAAVAAI
ncbi:MAG: aldose 1-epimerase family protein, partial [Planctomycetales bacterium]|nr:aldose 1-epimerase family protein [Planctomycetales bacterium]